MVSFQDNETRLKKTAKHAYGLILDIGYAQYPNTHLSGEVIGYDLNKPKELPPNCSKTIKGDVKDMRKKLKLRFSTIIASEFIEHIDNHKQFLKDCSKMLTSNGLLILSTPTPHCYRTLIGNVLFQSGLVGNREHCSVYIPRILNAVAEDAGFKLVTVEPATLFYIPFLTYQVIYVYRKVA